MSKRVLVTAADEDVYSVLELLRSKGAEVLHLPLERYVPTEDMAPIKKELDNLADYENIVLGNKCNALFFLKVVQKYDKLQEVRRCVTLTMNEETSDLLEAEGIPAICTHAEKKPIDLIEFMLRLKRLGATLYPCGSHKTEEVPGFLEELGMKVTELELYDLQGPGKQALNGYQKKVQEQPPQVILFHSRRSVTRTLTAFEKLNVEQAKIISADKGITKKLEDNGVSVDAQAEGSWESIVELV